MEATGVSEQNKQIFDKIQDIIANEDFVKAQYDFMKEHANTFDENDENKLEYTGIFESYVQITEQIIEVKLREIFSNEPVDAFY